MLWRHGLTDWNVEGRFQGQSDIPLNDTGRAQAVRAARMLAALRPDLIVSSDLSRAAETADCLAELTGLAVSYDKSLRERAGGLWEGLTGQEMRYRWPARYEIWEPPDGDPAETVAERISDAIERAAAAIPADGLAVLVSHGAAIRFGLARLLGLPTQLWTVLGSLSNCSWSLVTQTRRGWRLREHNAGSLPEPVLGDDQVGAEA